MSSRRYLDSQLEEVTRTIALRGEPERVESAKADKRSSLDFFAVRVPTLRKVVAKGFPFYGDPPATILSVWDHIWNNSPVFEVMSAALIYYYDIDPARPVSFQTISKWIARVENWAHADGLAAIFAMLCLEDRALVFPTMQSLVKSPRQWDRRVGIVSCVLGLRRGALSVSLAQLWTLVDELASEEDRYVAKGVAWVVREASRVDPESVLNYLSERQDRLSSCVRSSIAAELKEFVLRSSSRLFQRTGEAAEMALPS